MKKKLSFIIVMLAFISFSCQNDSENITPQNINITSIKNSLAQNKDSKNIYEKTSGSSLGERPQNSVGDSPRVYRVYFSIYAISKSCSNCSPYYTGGGYQDIYAISKYEAMSKINISNYIPVDVYLGYAEIHHVDKWV